MRRPQSVLDGMPEHLTEGELIVQAVMPVNFDASIEEIYPHVSGLCTGDGSRPWPYYRDVETGNWYALSQPCAIRMDRLAWGIPLDQLNYKGRHEALLFLQEVYEELASAAQRIGGTAEPECSPADALLLMDRFVARQQALEQRIEVIVAAPTGSSYSIDDWWRALHEAGLRVGDGDLFWIYAQSEGEIVCAEPFSKLGYFHRGDLGNDAARLPDVAIHFKLRNAKDPHERLALIIHVASTVAQQLLLATLRHSDGSVFDSLRAQVDLDEQIKRLGSFL